MEGVENLKKLVIAALDLHKEAAESYADKKISIWEGVKMLPKVFNLISAGKSVKEVLEEINDGISPEENADLENTIAERYNTSNPKAKIFLQHALENIVSTTMLINEFKQINDPVEQTPSL